MDVKSRVEKLEKSEQISRKITYTWRDLVGFLKNDQIPEELKPEWEAFIQRCEDERSGN
jgi:hypothetical protein